jgi:uncharacterized protein (TIGR02246 family)
VTDREAIDELRRRDIEASKSLDVEALISLWTDDCVMLSPDGPPTRGKAAMRAHAARLVEYARKMEVVEYEEIFEELQILGDTAVEWGIIRGAERPRTGGDLQRSQYQVMRVLKRQPDGRWLVHRSIFNQIGVDGEGEVTEGRLSGLAPGRQVLP